MPRPLKVHSKQNNIISLKEMSDLEIYNNIIYPLLKYYAGLTGPLYTAGNVGGIATTSVVGSMTDVYSTYEVGAHPSGESQSTTTFTIWQDQTAATESLTRPLAWTSSTIREMSDAELNTYIIDPAIGVITGGGLGSHYISRSSSAPGHVSGGTWTLIAQWADRLTSGTNTPGFYLWKLTSIAVTAVSSISNVVAQGGGNFVCDATSLSPGQYVNVSGTSSGTGSIVGYTNPTTYRVVTTAGATSFMLGDSVTGTPVSTTPGTLTGLMFNTGRPVKQTPNVVEMTSSAIATLAARLINRMRATGWGTYSLGTSAPTTPVGSTWASLGSWTDYTQDYANQSYTGYYTGSYLGYYSGSYASWYSGSYNDAYYGGYAGGTWYTGSYATWYTGSYAGWYTGSYTGYYTGMTVQSSTYLVSTYNLYIRRS